MPLLFPLPMVLLQLLYGWTLCRIWPAHRRRIVALLLGFHLICFAPFPIVLRTGWFGIEAALMLRVLGHLVIFFQLFALLHLGLLVILRCMGALRARKPCFSTQSVAAQALLACGLSLLVVHFGPRTCRTPKVRELELAFPDLPDALEGVRIAHLSDLHAGPHISPAHLHRWRTMVEATHPDLLLFTGDYVDGRAAQIHPVCEAFRGFPAPLGRFAILGNHDHLENGGAVAAALQAAGIEVLDNRAHAVSTSRGAFTLFGLQDPLATFPPRSGAGPQAPAMEALPPWRMALCHSPDEWMAARQAGARLTFCGHTHGGQINPFGFRFVRLLWPQISGLYVEEGQWLHVSAGLGVVTLPLRLHAPSEFTILTLHKKNSLAKPPA